MEILQTAHAVLSEPSLATQINTYAENSKKLQNWTPPKLTTVEIGSLSREWVQAKIAFSRAVLANDEKDLEKCKRERKRLAELLKNATETALSELDAAKSAKEKFLKEISLEEDDFKKTFALLASADTYDAPGT